MQHCHTHARTRVRTTYTNPVTIQLVLTLLVAQVCAPFAGCPNASATNLAGHHYGMPRDILITDDMCRSATSPQNDQECF